MGVIRIKSAEGELDSRNVWCAEWTISFRMRKRKNDVVLCLELLAGGVVIEGHTVQGFGQHDVQSPMATSRGHHSY